MAKGQHKYHDEWILNHYDPNVNWHRLLDEYNKTFGVEVKYPTFVSHMNRELKLCQNDKKYTEAEDCFLKENYPKYGYLKTAELFNNRFSTRTPKAIQGRCKALGLSINEERKVELKKEIGASNYRVVPIGTISSGLYGTPAIKNINGWERLDKKISGSGEIVVHLDGNKENNEPRNLMTISKWVKARMAYYSFWSEDPEINRTAILWCQLDEALIKSGFRKPRKSQRKPKELKKKPIPPVGKSGERYIYATGRKNSPWVVRIDRPELYFYRRFETFDKAIRVRDMLLNGIQH